MVDREVDLRRLFGLIRRRSRLIVSVTAICVIVSGLVSIAIPPVYSSTATVIFDPQRKDLLNSEMPLNAGMADNTRVESEVELLRSDSLLLQVLATQQASSPADAPSQPGLKAQFLGWFGLKKLPSEAARDQANQQLNTLRHAINVQRRGPTYIIAIEARAEAPEIAADIANALAKAYLDEQVSAKVEVALGARDLIQLQLVEPAPRSSWQIAIMLHSYIKVSIGLHQGKTAFCCDIWLMSWTARPSSRHRPANSWPRSMLATRQIRRLSLARRRWLVNSALPLHRKLHLSIRRPRW